MEKNSKSQRRQSKQFTSSETSANESSSKGSGKRQTKEVAKLEWKVGLLVDAKDSANNWYKSRIIKLDQEGNRCKVHFLGWNSRYDQWFDLNSNDLRICSDQTQTSETASQEKINEVANGDQPSRECALFKTGDQVLAKWTDECFYQARVGRVTYKNDQLYYEVKFYDGIKKLLRSQFVRAISEEEAKILGIETGTILNSESLLQETQPTTSQIESQEKSTNELKQEDEKRREDAELLLSIQNAQVSENEPSSESKAIENTNQAQVEPQAIQEVKMEITEEKKEDIKAVESTPTQTATTVTTTTQNTSNTSSEIRKSLRVKRLRTFTEEIVFDSPASSITYNLASISSPVITTSSKLFVSNSERRKVEHTEQLLPSEHHSEAKENSKQKKFKEEKHKDKTEDLIKETLKLAKNKHSKIKLDQLKAEEKIKNEKKKENKKLKEKEKQQQRNIEEEGNENKKRKKKKKDKKELLKKLIETSQQQLRQQQMLIEKELEKKTQKKLRKLMRKQELALQQQIQQNTLNIFLNNQLIREQFQSNNIMLNSPAANLMTNSLSNSQSSFSKIPKTPTPTPNPSFFNLQNLNTETAPLQAGKLESQRSSNEPIKCTFANCDKTFRKQSLLDYHIKYYHYANQPPAANSTTTATSNETLLNENGKNSTDAEMKSATVLPTQTVAQPRKRRVQSSSNTTKQTASREEPYEVIHCKCAQNINRGFMIQCDVCLCWQHGDCEKIAKASDVPKKYLCWICKNPGNKLKKLKFESWIINNLSEDSIKSDQESFVVNREQLNSLNDCSKRYYNLNLLMFTLEHQMSLLNRITKENDFVLISESNDEFEKLVQNITHLQESLIKQFNEFNQKIDEYEEKYNDKASISKNINLRELYHQIEAAMG